MSKTQTITGDLILHALHFMPCQHKLPARRLCNVALNACTTEQSTSPQTLLLCAHAAQYCPRRHKISQAVRYSKPSLQGLSNGPQPNVARTAEFHSNTGSVAGAWVEYTDGSTGKKYWHNRITNLVRNSETISKFEAFKHIFPFSGERPTCRNAVT